MNIELKQVKIFHSLSQHSFCFRGTLFINNIQAAFVSSNGTGSPFFYSVFVKNGDEDYAANKKLLDAAIEYANSQSPIYNRELGTYEKSDIDAIVNDCLTEYINNQELVTM